MDATLVFKGQELQATKFGDAKGGHRYVTPAGFEVEVIAMDETHAMLRTNKGKEMRTVLTAGCYGPIAVADAPSATTPDAGEGNLPASAPEAAPEPAATPKRKRDMSVAELQAEYVRVVGRPPSSTDRRYLCWKLSEAAKGGITLGAIERRPTRDPADMQVLPLGMERPVVGKLDAAWEALGFRSRMAFLRDAMVAYLRDQEGAEATAAADAIEAGTF